MMSRICNAHHSHLYYPIYYCGYHLNIYFFQKLNDSLTIWICCSCIVFAVIWNKRVKHSMMCVNVQIRWGYFLVYVAEVFQWYAFNRHRYIATIVFRLNLVCKCSYYTFCIILMGKHILESWTTLEWLSVCVTTVMRSKNA